MPHPSPARQAAPSHQGFTVAAVAARCGFSSASHFSRRFHEAYGLTPRDWRRRAHTEAHRPRQTPADATRPGR
ncbi:AraC family transcriptional regulator [Streptomyces sp. NPDC002520]